MFCAGDKELNCGGNNEVGVFKVSSLHVVVLDVSFAWLCLAFSCSRSCPSRHLTLNTWAATMTTTVIGAVLLCGMFTKCFLLSPPNTTIIFRIYDTEMVDINVPNISPVSCARECLAWRSSYTYVGLQSGTSVKTIAPAFSFSQRFQHNVLSICIVLLWEQCPSTKPADFRDRMQQRLQWGRILQMWSQPEDEHPQDSKIDRQVPFYSCRASKSVHIRMTYIFLYFAFPHNLLHIQAKYI